MTGKRSRPQANGTSTPRAQASGRETSQRISDEAWIAAALRHLADANVDDIRVEELARDIGVTKGSFYWHFRNRQHLLERVLEHWMDRATVQVTRWARAHAEGGTERLVKLLSLPATTPPEKKGADIELAIRSWARRDPLARKTVDQVDEVRAAFFIELMAEAGITGAEAERRAAVAQAFMLGEAFLGARHRLGDRLRIIRFLAETLTAI
ncbi:TetR/AcrR family transcriptional regulator [Pararhizobium haloflavum]|uniref:TetR/AcrR family transcriptional regulator n=1 Tax=Pararhizobium haloflavum TaxID=2037914 RepID=UPI0012FFD5D5|nr:TetR/AcrR family transcriptional regulator [Pararhizobium haloflavum]